MKLSRTQLSLAFIAVGLCVLAVALADVSLRPAGAVASAAQAQAQAQDTPTSASASGSSSLTSNPTLTWTTPSNSNPVGNAGETVTIAGAGFDVSTGSVLLQLETLTSAKSVCPSMITPANFITETAASFQASFVINASARANARFVVCAFPSGQGRVVHSNTLTVVTPTLCADGVCSAGATDSVKQGQRTITVSGRDWEPVGGLVTITVCCNAGGGTPLATTAATPTVTPQPRPTHTPIVIPTIGVTPPTGQGLAFDTSAGRHAALAPITQTVSISPCADNPARGCFTAAMSLPANTPVGATFSVSAQAQGNAVVAHGATVRIVAPPAAPGGVDGALTSLGAAVPQLFVAVILLVLVMLGILLWLATRRESGVGRQM